MVEADVGGMNWIDYIIIAVVLLSAVLSLVRGLMREVMALVVWVVAVGVGYFFHPHLAQRLPWIESDGLRTLAAFTILFVIAMILGALLSYLVSTLFDRVGISGTDRLLGGLFGALRGAALVVVFVLAAGMFPLNTQPWWQESLLLDQFVEAAVWLRQQFPPSLASHFTHL
jgi:membrane protein required for colicin V production